MLPLRPGRSALGPHRRPSDTVRPAKSYWPWAKRAPLVERVGRHACSVCERAGTIRFHTFPLERAAAISIDLCGEHLRGLLGRSLGPFAFHQLCRKLRAAGVSRDEVFLLHDAFYDSDGRALQPAFGA